MKKVKVNTLKHSKYTCQCGNIATWYIFTISDDNTKRIHYKCNDCMTTIVELTNKIETFKTDYKLTKK